ncbi:hypothetical protein [Legionella parisiensis]|uniref:hypothetical protein n=1 Tax=Legionella parisiensis TaxID=45071 RepID=UPI0007308301|nr:hypothetical protein [Legionella parisiensis]KTD42251.1 ankyrin repeat protein [Legionella parisiensis]STX72318.1 ankyrin repeat protein [Legionella parisiensis]
MAHEELFKEIVELIKRQDVDGVRDILAKNKQIQELPKLVDEEGNTLFHHLIKSGNLSLMRASEAYERGFAASYPIRNKEGKTPYQCVADIKDAEFKESAARAFGPTWKQAHILNQFIVYLKIQHQLKPKEYKQEDITAIIDALDEGHCNGLSIIWLVSWLNNEENKYYELFSDIIYWDGSIEHLSEELKSKFEVAISLTRMYQMDRQILSHEKKQGAQSKLAVKEAIRQKKEDETGEKVSIDDVQLPELLSDEVPDFFGRTQNVWHTYVDTLYQEKYYRGQFTINSLAFLLDQIADQEKGISFHASGHVIAAGIKNGTLYLFDSNYDKQAGKETIPREFNLRSPSGQIDAAKEIYKQLHFRAPPEINTFFDFDRVNILDMKERPRYTQYPSDIDIKNKAGEAKALAFYKKVEENNFTEIDPFEFARLSAYFDSVLNETELANLFEKTVFKKELINQIIQVSRWDFISPLLVLIEDANNENALNCLLRNGADPHLIVGHQSAIEAAKNRDKENLVHCMEEHIKRMSAPTEHKKQLELKCHMNIIKIPANEREQNILAVLNLLNSPLLNNKDNTPSVVVQNIKAIVVQIDHENTENISEKIKEIKALIKAHGKDREDNSYVRNILDVFENVTQDNFKKIRESLTLVPEFKKIMDAPIVEPRSSLG